MTEAHLGFAIDSSQAKTAAVDLDKLTGSAERAEKAERGLATASKQAEASAAGLAGMSRSATGATSGLASAEGQVATRMTLATTAVRANTAALEINAAAAGATRMRTQQLMYQMVDMGQALPLLLSGNIYGLQNMGFQIAQIGQMYYGQGGTGAALKDMGRMLGGVLARVAPVGIAVGVLAGGVAALRGEINETSKATVSYGDVALGVWQMVRDGIYSTFRPAIDTVSGWFGGLWEWIKDKAGDAFNNIARGVAGLGADINFVVDTITAAWKGSVTAIKTVWSALPGAIGDLVYQAAEMTLAGINYLIKKAADGIDWVIEKVNKVPGVDIPTIGAGDKTIDFGRNPYKGQAAGFKDAMTTNAAGTLDAIKQAWAERQRAFAEIAKSNPLAELQQKATANALERTKAAADDAGKSLKGAAEKALPAWMQFGKATDAARDAMRFVGRTARGFVDDFVSGLKNGESVWRSFADAAINALDRIANKLMDDAFSSLFGYGNGGGLLSSLFGLGGGAGFFPPAPTPAIGLFASGTPSAPAGLAIVGEKGPELVRFRGGEEVIPNHRLRAANDYAANQNAPVIQIIDQRSGGTIEREDRDGVTRLIVRDEIKKSGLGTVEHHAAMHRKAVSDRFIR